MCVTPIIIINSSIRSQIQLHFLVTLFLKTHTMFDVVEVVLQFSVTLNYCENITIIIINYEKYINV